MKRFLLTLSMVSALGCAATDAPKPPAHTTNDVDAPSPKTPDVLSQKPTRPTSLKLDKATFRRIFLSLGDVEAKRMADQLEGATIEDIGPDTDGFLRGRFIHVQKGSAFLAGTPMRMGLSAIHVSPRAKSMNGAAAAQEAKRLLDAEIVGLPKGVTTPKQLASAVDEDPDLLFKLESRGGLPSASLLGLRRLADRPSRVVGTSGDPDANGVSRLDVEVEFFALGVRFTAESTAGTWSVTRVESIAGMDWTAFLKLKMAEGAAR